MKKTLLILVLLTTITFAKDTTTTQIHLKDTLVTKNITGNQKDIWSGIGAILPYIISIGGLILAYVTIKNQRKITQAQITANFITKWIEEVIQEATEIQVLFEKSYAYTIKKSGVDVYQDVEPESYKADPFQIDLHAYRLKMYLSPDNKNEKIVADMIDVLCQRLLNYRDLSGDKKKRDELINETKNINALIGELEVSLIRLIDDKRRLIHVG